MNLYHLSSNNMNGKTIFPRVPENFFTKNGYEDSKTKRVCFSTSIDGCLRGMSQNLTNKKFYVHIPDPSYKFNIYILQQQMKFQIQKLLVKYGLQNQ